MADRFELLGFVDLQEMQNVFTNQISAIEEDLRLNGVPANYRVIIEWLDNIRLDLRKRSKFNLTKYLINNPDVKAQVRDDKIVETSKEQVKSWQERIAKNRERAKLGES